QPSHPAVSIGGPGGSGVMLETRSGWRSVGREEASMRAIPITAITFASLLLSSIGSHADGTWCAQYGSRGGGTNCGFYSFQQCEAARSGNGGVFYPNPFSAYCYAGQTQRRYQRER